jgi:hypothetical protein
LHRSNLRRAMWPFGPLISAFHIRRLFEAGPTEVLFA